MKWLRLYNDTITDPKWRVVAAESGQPLTAVLAVWMSMLINASDADERGTLQGWNDRFAGAAIDLRGDAVRAIREAMQGVVLDGMRLTGWDKRQRASDNIAERVHRHRAKAKETPPSGGTTNGTGGRRNDTKAECNGNVTLQKRDANKNPLNLSSLPTPTLIQETEEDEDAGARAVVIHVAQQVAAMAGFVGPVDKRPDLDIVAGWLKEGADPDVDIIPAVAVAMNRTTQVRIRTFGYFSDEVETHRRAHLAPKPEKSNVLPIRSQQRRGHSGCATGSRAQIGLVARELKIGDFDADGPRLREG